MGKLTINDLSSSIIIYHPHLRSPRHTSSAMDYPSIDSMDPSLAFPNLSHPPGHPKDRGPGVQPRAPAFAAECNSSSEKWANPGKPGEPWHHPNPYGGNGGFPWVFPMKKAMIPWIWCRWYLGIPHLWEPEMWRNLLLRFTWIFGIIEDWLVWGYLDHEHFHETVCCRPLLMIRWKDW